MAAAHEGDDNTPSGPTGRGVKTVMKKLPSTSPTLQFEPVPGGKSAMLSLLTVTAKEETLNIHTPNKPIRDAETTLDCVQTIGQPWRSFGLMFRAKWTISPEDISAGFDRQTVGNDQISTSTIGKVDPCSHHLFNTKTQYPTHKAGFFNAGSMLYQR